MSFDPRHQSRHQLDGPDRAPARTMLRAIGVPSSRITV
jgi:hypothetical protein